ncbi:transcriptional regulator, AraC family [Halobacillus alkaliphilus]|uniref:Transcriptional regulator, AraC family n=1 Tax=Halobacillus alkaliphilus TaxID=396056 RepID=A0A1I2NK85_9BACI|nr:AraC family transcriptional regulator [Halobacillus alkaliphilus]SFG04294.1 transcriptional regulator, AraC family [Halobacillus alkaliphilus]
MAISHHELTHLLKDCSIALQVPVLLLNHKRKLTFQFPDSFHQPPDFMKKSFFPFLETIRKSPNTLEKFSDEFGQSIFLYSMKIGQEEPVDIVFGPFLHKEIGKKEIDGFIKAESNCKVKTERLLNYYDQLPVLNPMQMLSMERILIRILSEKQEGHRERKHSPIQKVYEHYLINETSPNNNYQLQERFTQLFKLGHSEALDIYREWRKQLFSSPSHSNAVRLEKNQLIRLIGELNQMCLAGGAQLDEVMSLSEFFMNYLETKNTTEELQELEENVIQSFMARLQRAQEAPVHSPLVERSKRYIFQNLSEALSLQDIAAAMNVHPNYLSGVFKKETGISISQFINVERVKEAKEMLSISDFTLLDISLKLGFNSQSYFTRVFKKIEGIGPNEFRKKHHIMEE